MRFLLFVNLVLLGSCAPAVYKKLQPAAGNIACIAAFRPHIQRALYQASVDVTGNHLSGLLLIKEMPDSSTRIVFTNEAGFSFFDFEFSRNNGFRVHSIIPKMDKAAVRKTLRKDFELLLMNVVDTAVVSSVFQKGEDRYHAFYKGEDVYYYITDTRCAQLIRMERGSRKRKVLEATRGALNEGIPETMHIRHSNFNFTIDLKRIYDHAE
ncbi:hypothetical protein LL912_15005 [Niabella sp. CC-SYL272]|uniref:hypothetical protein n=1 Tax=Niabella agricola TaxID=2891571 RepID=UPI001F3ED787|nr:hypothetical protein [Niabella agricola]MCF3110089.1 hypothetical protein [Niabella agricola]